ncbi:RagB/SusD family nutrient uptake outer membrane protein [Prolixibacteraceae bacterium JC049]|nr:RagB/SusD family nutrient uptake outer membrane protein [Prolixibacteraceae bacterium JC049]
MMKIKVIIYLFAVLLITEACDNNLDLFPPDKISDDSFWKTPDDFRMAANSLYGILPFRSLDLNADLMRGEGENSVSTGNNLPPDNDGFWNSSFDRLRACNYLIQNAEANPGVDAKRYVGEARFFRAFVYYRLVSRYGDVPLITTTLDTESEELKSPRESREKVIDFCIQDLQSAIPNLPLRSEMTASELGRITKGAAQTLLAKIALFEATWSKYNGGEKVDERLQIAIDASNSVINSGEYALYNKHGDDSYRQLFWNPDADDVNLGEKPEKVLAIVYRKDFKTHGASYAIQDLSVTKKAVDLFLCTDGLPVDKSPLFQGYATYTSEYANRDNRMLQSIMKVGDEFWTNNGPMIIDAADNYINRNQTGYKIWKFNGEGEDRVQWSKEFNDIEVFRYPEVLLMFAEAKFEKDGSISDSDLDKTINVLRERGKIVPLTNEFVNSNGLSMLTEIRRERTVELMFEGRRLEDLKRWGIAVQEMTQSMKGIQWDNSDWSKVGFGIEAFTANGTDAEGFIIKDLAADRKFSEKHMLFPLPLQELQLTKWNQNPGW